MFQRQIELKDFDQEKLTTQTALVLGVGGIGTNVAIGLCRLGIKQMYLIDKDIVELHNLNRQQLFSLKDVGRKKVEAAYDALTKHHNLCTTIGIMHIDALEHWEMIVNVAKKSTVVFNTIDHGDKWDFCVGALCHSLQIPVFLGGTEPFYGHLISTFAQVPSGPCYACAHDLNEIPVDPRQILDLKTLSHLPPDPQPDKGGSTTYSACICSQLLLGQFGTYLMQQDGYILKHSVILRLINLEMDTFCIERNIHCCICGEKK